MEKRIDLEKRNRSLDQIHELNLDNCRSTTIEGLTEEFLNLKSLSLNGVGLTSLKGFPVLANLRKLEMADNRIGGGLQVLKDCVKLTQLNLGNNKIKDIETLEPLKELTSLKSLDLYRNDVTQVEGYRSKIFELLPGLSYLDGTDAHGKEADESDLEEDEVLPMNGKSVNEDADEVKAGNGANDSSLEDSPHSPTVSGLNEHSIGTTEIDNSESDEDVADEGDEDDDDEDEDEDGDDDDDEGTEEMLSLKDIYADFEKESDGADYEEEDEMESEDDIDEEDDVLESPRVGAGGIAGNAASDRKPPQGDIPRRGVKRQHEEDSDESDS